jgi:sulfite oxidase
MAASAIIAGSGALSGDSIQCEAREKQDQLPTYTMAQVSKNNGEGPEKRVWMTYGGCVYDVTDFIANHPGGSQKILLAAGGPIEPHWHGTFNSSQ